MLGLMTWPQPWRLTSLLMLGAVILFACVSCAGTRVTRVDTGTVVDLSGRWNDTDSRMVAEEMVKEALTQPWLGHYTSKHSRQPVVVVGRVTNKSHEHISIDTFINDLERELTNSQKVRFVAGQGAREDIRQERKEQATYAQDATQKKPGRELGADFMLQGAINTILDEEGGTKVKFYQVDLVLVDIEENVKAWFGQKKIKKIIERRRVVF